MRVGTIQRWAAVAALAGFVFHWCKNLRCEERRVSVPATGFVELEFATACRDGTHSYRGQVDADSYPPQAESRGVGATVRDELLT